MARDAPHPEALQFCTPIPQKLVPAYNMTFIAHPPAGSIQSETPSLLSRRDVPTSQTMTTPALPQSISFLRRVSRDQSLRVRGEENARDGPERFL